MGRVDKGLTHAIAHQNWNGLIDDYVSQTDINAQTVASPLTTKALTTEGYVTVYKRSSDPSTAGWGEAEKGLIWYNTTEGRYKYWSGSAILVFPSASEGGAPVDASYVTINAEAGLDAETLHGSGITDPLQIHAPLDVSYVVFKADSTYYARACGAGLSNYSGVKAYSVIKNALDALTSGGTIYLKNGTYLLGEILQIDNCDSNWTPANANIACEVDTGDKQEGTGSVKTSVADAFTTGLACYHNISSVDLSDYAFIGFWLKPSKSITGSPENPTTATLSILLDNSLGCGSPLKTLKIGHPENLTANTWKWVTCSLGDASGLTAIQSIGIQINIDEGEWNFKIDHICVLKDESLRPLSNTRITGDKKAVIKVGDHCNIPIMRLISKSMVEIDSIEIDGNSANNERIDACRAITLESSTDCNLHDLYIHHTRGEGVRIFESSRNRVTNCRIEYNENAQVSILGYSSSADYNVIANNIFRYPTNDNSIYILDSASHNIINGNNIYVGNSSYNGVNFNPSGRETSYNIFSNNYIENCQYGIQIGYGTGTFSFNTIVGNVIYNTEKHGIVLGGNDDHTCVMGNTLNDHAGAYVSIRVENAATYCVVVGNVCGKGVSGTGGTGCVIDHNTSA